MIGAVFIGLPVYGLSTPPHVTHSANGLVLGPFFWVLAWTVVRRAIPSSRRGTLVWCRDGVAILAGDGTVAGSLQWSQVERVAFRKQARPPGRLVVL